MCISITSNIILNENFAARLKRVRFPCSLFTESFVKRFLHRQSSIYGVILLSLNARATDEITR